MNTATLAGNAASLRMRGLSPLSAFDASRCGAIAPSIAWLRWVQPISGFPTFS